MLSARTNLAHTRYELLVVGGGIHGLFAAYDAAQRGLRVALVERGDVGSGLSFNHQRTIHGGLRAIETGHLGKARAQIEERRTWAVIAPHLVAPLPFLIGTYRGTKRSRWVVRTGFALYDLVGRRRNAGLPPALHLPAGSVVSVAEAERLSPSIDRRGLTGGAMWHDYQARHPDRLNWLVAQAAINAGVDLVTYADVTALRMQEGRVTGAHVSLWPEGHSVEVASTATLLCVGSGLSALHRTIGLGGAPPLVRAMNLVLDRPAPAVALAAIGPLGRTFTCVPWHGRALVGTHQSDQLTDASEQAPPWSAIEAMLDEVNATFPMLAATRADVRVVHHGLAPAVLRGGRPELLPEPVFLRHAARGVPGVDSLVGVKFTTARAAAAIAIDAIAADAGRPGTSRTAVTPLPHGATPGSDDALPLSARDALPADVAASLLDWYGTEARAVATYCLTRGLTKRIGDSLVLDGEIAYAVEHAGAWRLTDVVLRRTRLGGDGHPGESALDTAARVMAPLRGWSDAERGAEVALVEHRYRPWAR